MYRKRKGTVEVFLVHPGGPFWAKKDRGGWSIPKGEYQAGDDPLEAAQREFHEETGFIAHGPFRSLGMVKQSGGKLVVAWAFEGDCEPAQLRSNLLQLEWPPRSKRVIEIPEVDRGGWFSLDDAAEYLLPSQLPFLSKYRETFSAQPKADVQEHR
jgi:predicted NUDIX family NTP pyrophosphohydrolase